jgi:hypothetical protein
VIALDRLQENRTNAQRRADLLDGGAVLLARLAQQVTDRRGAPPELRPILRGVRPDTAAMLPPREKSHEYLGS